MMHPVKRLARAATYAFVTNDTAALARASSSSQRTASAQRGHASDASSVSEKTYPDAFETASVQALLRHLQALRPAKAGTTGAFYPETFEARLQSCSDKPPQDYWTGHADAAAFDKDQLYSFRLRVGQSASRALDAFFRGPTITECGGAISAAQWRVVQDTLGSAKFDAVFGQAGAQTHEMLRLRIASCATTWDPLAYFVDWGPTALSGGAFEPAQARPGDLYYIQGVPRYEVKHPDGAGTGYNVLYAGDNAQGAPLFAGFGLHPAQTEQGVRDWLVQAYNQPRSPRTLAYIRHCLHPGMFNLQAVGLEETLPVGDPAQTIGFLAATQRRMRFDRLYQAREMSALELVSDVAETLARQLEEHVDRQHKRSA